MARKKADPSPPDSDTPPPSRPSAAASPAAAKRKRLQGAAAPTSARNIKARERQEMALDMRKRGATFQDIAKELGYKGHTAAMGAVKAALDRVPVEAVNDLRKVYNARYEKVLFGIYDAAINPSHKQHEHAVNAFSKLMAKMVDLNGVAVEPDPKKREVGVTLTGVNGGPMQLEGIFKALPPERQAALLNAMAGGDGPPEEGFVDVSGATSLGQALPHLTSDPGPFPNYPEDDSRTWEP